MSQAPWTVIQHISDQIRKDFAWNISHSQFGCVMSYNKLHVFDTGVWSGHAWKLICAAYSCLTRERQAALEQRSVLYYESFATHCVPLTNLYVYMHSE